MKISSKTLHQTGFTLIEILVVVVIIGILGAIIVPNLLGRPDQARITAAQSDLRSLANALDISEGTVKKADTAKGRVTIAHGPLKNLNMPRMTMIFRVAQPTLLDGIANGDRIRFSAEDQNGRMVVTAIQKAR